MKRETRIYLLLTVLMMVLFVVSLFYGSVNIPFLSVLKILFGLDVERASWSHIVLDSRLTISLTALLAGASLAVSGLLLQTLFQNPLAGPSILGVSDGANLGVALVILLSGGTVGSLSGIGIYFGIILAAFMGALLILGTIIYFAGKVKNSVMLLIIGIMIGYLTSSIISILNYYASADKVFQFVMWGMGDYGAVSWDNMPYFAVFILLGLALSIALIKPLNALLLGENYAANLGVKVRKVRIIVLLCTGLLTAAVTAFCGPISFIGLSVPHIARLLLGSSNHKHLVPITILSGATISLLCSILTVVPWMDSIMPLNAITPLVGAPIIIYVIVNRKNIQYFN